MANFTSVLKKIGTVLIDGSQIATQVLGFPFISQLLGQIKVGTGTAATVAAPVVSDFNAVAGILSTVEAAYPTIAGAKIGSAKLVAAAPLVQQVVMSWAQSNLPGHTKVLDPTKLATASAALASNFADILNSFGA